MAGHAAATKVGGRRMSLSKSPGASKGLAGSPPAATDKAGAPTSEDTTATDKKGDYPRPEDNHNASKEDGSKKEDSKKEEAKKKNEKPAFDNIKQTIPKQNPAMNKASNIKQPSGKAKRKEVYTKQIKNNRVAIAKSP